MQQINLYQVEKTKGGFQFEFEHLLGVLAVYASVLVLVTAYSVYDHSLSRKETERLNNLQEEKNKKLQDISIKVPSEQTRNQIIEEIKKLEAANKEKKEILSVLGSVIKSKDGDYSIYFESLAKKTIPGLWLTEIVLKNGGEYLMLEGKSLKPEYVPKLISNLSLEPAFSGKTFEVFKMYLDDKTEDINFMMETKTKTESN